MSKKKVPSDQEINAAFAAAAQNAKAAKQAALDSADSELRHCRSVAVKVLLNISKTAETDCKKAVELAERELAAVAIPAQAKFEAANKCLPRVESPDTTLGIIAYDKYRAALRILETERDAVIKPAARKKQDTVSEAERLKDKICLDALDACNSTIKSAEKRYQKIADAVEISYESARSARVNAWLPYEQAHNALLAELNLIRILGPEKNTPVSPAVLENYETAAKQAFAELKQL